MFVLASTLGSCLPAVSLASPPQQVSRSSPATWLPPVHIAPQRQQPSSAQPPSPNERYPGIFVPESSSSQAAAAGLNQPRNFPAADLPASGEARSLFSRRPRPSLASDRNAAGLSDRMPPPSRRARPSQAQWTGNYPEPERSGVQLPAEEQESGFGMESRDFAGPGVQPAFVADMWTAAAPPEPVSQRTAVARRESRGEFARTIGGIPPSMPASREYSELEQPLPGFSQAPENPATGQWGPPARPRPQAQLPDSSVLDASPGLPARQTEQGGRPVPARPAGVNRDKGGAWTDGIQPFPDELAAPPERSPTEGLESNFIPPSFEEQGRTFRDQERVGGQRAQKTMSCDELREKLLSEPLSEISLDVSPPLPERGELPGLPDGDWLDQNGQLLARGKMVALSRGYVIVDTAEGRRKVSVARLGDSSLALIAAAWQLPGDCALGTGEYAGRCWSPQLSTWHASNLCHKPLYFEQVQLERYGHSAGPILGPLRSSAHFFGSLALWPYHSAIHPANECLYPLGYFRPGNCAPWLVEPFPFSGPGAFRQGAAITGAAFIF